MKMTLMKTTLDISDALMERARQHARKSGQTLRALVEDGLRLALDRQATAAKPFRLADRSVGRKGGHNPLEEYDWEALRDEMYGGR